MQKALLKFSLYSLVVIDNDTPFKAVFTIACDASEILCECVSKRNQKFLLVEISHRFLNKRVTIATSDKDTIYCFVEAGISAGCVRNSAPIDGTHIIRSIPTIDWELHFPLDISLTSLLKLIENQTNYIVKYLRLTDKDKIFSIEIIVSIINAMFSHS